MNDRPLKMRIVIPWTELDRTTVPGGSGDLRLMRRGAEFSIMLGDIELMNSRLSGSEEALARLSCDRIGSLARPHVLLGGLGMGFTLRAALACLGAEARIVVAELVPAVVDWARGPLAAIFDGSLSDPRVSVRLDDVGRLIGAASSTYDAILLDVDNGPEGLTRNSNESLYDRLGLLAARRALRPGGILAVWSSRPAPNFSRRLIGAGFETEDVRVRARGGGGGARHVIWIAAKPRSRS